MVVTHSTCLGVELASRDPIALADFYIETLGFRCESSNPEHVRLRLGEGFIALLRADATGRPMPGDSRSHDTWFRHVAIVVRDLQRAYARLRARSTNVISTAPQTLPDWNPASAGIRALYFRDPEGHPLELIQFPPGKGKPVWHEASSQLFLGIDHTAIVVASSKDSVEFYRSATGLEPAATVLNRGQEQARLSGVERASVHVTSLPGIGQMGLEFLEYLSPLDGREIPIDTTANDLWWSRTVIQIDDRPTPGRELADPDHHGVRLI